MQDDPNTQNNLGDNTNYSPEEKKCVVCGYSGHEAVCPKCKMLMEEVCKTCNFAKSECICNIN